MILPMSVAVQLRTCMATGLKDKHWIVSEWENLSFPSYGLQPQTITCLSAPPDTIASPGN